MDSGQYTVIVLFGLFVILMLGMMAMRGGKRR
jgi:hypothetical protein